MWSKLNASNNKQPQQTTTTNKDVQSIKMQPKQSAKRINENISNCSTHKNSSFLTTKFDKVEEPKKHYIVDAFLLIQSLENNFA